VSTARAGAALVTGASAGIGAEFARALAARGHDLVLVARRRDALESLAAEVAAAHGVRTEVLVADLTADGGVELVEARLGDEARPVGLLVNNAGFGTYGHFSELDVDHEVDEIELNVVALVRLTHAALRAMGPRRNGVIVNVSSIAGFQPSPRSATYGATKAFVTSFTHALREETRGSGVRFLLVCPGYTHSEFHRVAGLGPSGLPGFVWMDADVVVAQALHDLDRGRAVSIPGLLNRVVAAGGATLPARVTNLVAGRIIRRT
jgi:short-subunit dehydrogenase